MPLLWLFHSQVPGGVGPMTVAVLMRNTLLSFQRRLAAVGVAGSPVAVSAAKACS